MPRAGSLIKHLLTRLRAGVAVTGGRREARPLDDRLPRP